MLRFVFVCWCVVCRDCPPELVVLEGGVVGHPNMGPDLRNLIHELRQRDKEWDMLTLAFALPPKREWHRDGDDGAYHITRQEPQYRQA